jgi:hypothetical protein
MGGKYMLAATATWNAGNVTLQTLAPDGSTWVPAASALTADGSTTPYLPPGQYRFAITSATAVYVSIARVPSE